MIITLNAYLIVCSVFLISFLTMSTFYVLNQLFLLPFLSLCLGGVKAFNNNKVIKISAPINSIFLVNLKLFCSIFCGSLATFYLHQSLQINVVMSSSIIGIIAFLFFPQHGLALYCGSFLGMSTAQLFANPFDFFIAVLLLSLIFYYNQKYLVGFGGKLGAMAFLSALIIALRGDFVFETMIMPSNYQNILLVFYTVLSGLMTYYLINYRQQNAIFASSIVAFINSLLLIAAFNDFGNLLALAVFCGTFVGMTTKKRLNGLISIAVTSLVAGLLFIYTLPYFNGLGGKLGGIALISVLIVFSLEQLLKVNWTHLNRSFRMFRV